MITQSEKNTEASDNCNALHNGSQLTPRIAALTVTQAITAEVHFYLQAGSTRLHTQYLI